MLTPLCPTCMMPARVFTKAKTMKTFIMFVSHVRSKISSNRKATMVIYAFTTVLILAFQQYFLGQKEDLFVKNGAFSNTLSNIGFTVIVTFVWHVVLFALARNLLDLYVKHFSAFAERTYIWNERT